MKHRLLFAALATASAACQSPRPTDASATGVARPALAPDRLVGTWMKNVGTGFVGYRLRADSTLTAINVLAGKGDRWLLVRPDSLRLITHVGSTSQTATYHVQELTDTSLVLLRRGSARPDRYRKMNAL